MGLLQCKHGLGDADEPFLVPNYVQPRWFWNLLTLELRRSFHDYTRAGGGAACDVCGRELQEHPLWETGLNLLCDGTLVHL